MSERQYPALSLYISGYECPYVRSTFPAGEVHIRLEYLTKMQVGERPSAKILANIRSSDDVMALLMLTDAARRMYDLAKLELMIPYFPYAQQDRVCAFGEALSSRVMCDLINSQNYDSVTVWDPHSDVVPAMLNNVIVWQQKTLLSRLPNAFEKAIFVAPDAGALKKVQSISVFLKRPFIRADKSRNPETGEITGTVVYSDPVGDADFVILDDICIGGKTFTELAEVLRPLTTGKIKLCVTHGVFNRGLEPFVDLIDQVIVFNPFRDLLVPENTNLIYTTVRV